MDHRASPRLLWDPRNPANRRRARHWSAGSRGFSLVELVIVMAIVGILLAVAVPTYREHVRKAARADLQSFLTGVAARQQQFLVDKRRYAASLAALGMSTPSSVVGRFADPVTFEVADAVPPTFRLVATAIGDQVHDKCPTLWIDSVGNRQPAGCW